MGKALKVIGIVIGAFVALFIIAAVAISLLFEPNDYREDIERAVFEGTGRELIIEGDISMSVFPWLAVELGATTLEDLEKYGGEPFLSFESASLSVRLLPVIIRQDLIIGAADVTGLNLNLKVDDQGNSNWTDFPEPDPEEAAREAQVEAIVEQRGEPSDLDVNRIDVIDARISYSDAAAPQPVVLSELNIGVGGVAGRERLVVDGFTIDGVIEGVASIPSELSFRTDEIVIDGAESVLSLAPIVIEALGITINATVEPFSYAGEPTPKARIEIEPFSPRSVMTQFDVEPPATADPSALSEISIAAEAEVTPDAINMNDVSFVLDDTTFSGNLSVPLGEGGSYRFDLRGDSIDVARYMAPADENVEQDVAEGAPVEIPADLIRTLKASGKAVLERATLGEIVFDNIEVGLNAGNGRLRLHPMSSQLFGGAYQGDVRIDASGSTPVLSVNERIENVDVGKLAIAMFEAQNVTGTVNGSFRLTGRGNDTLAIQESLGGDIGLRLDDGTYEGTDIWYELRRARAKLKGEEPPEPTLPAKTDFSSVSMTGQVVNGIMRSDDLDAQMPFMQLTGAGSVNIPAGTVDYSLTARVLEKPEFMGDVTAEELDDFTSTVIPLKITGPLASPSVRPDVEQLLRKRVEEEIEDVLKDKLGDLFN